MAKNENQELPMDYIDKIPLIDEDNANRNKLIKLIKEMTQINSTLRPELDLLLNDENKYPELYNRYQMLKKNEYIENLFINAISRNNSNEMLLCKNKNEEEKVDLSIINESNENENINKIFLKRSNSMKRVTQNSSSEKS